MIKHDRTSGGKKIEVLKDRYQSRFMSPRTSALRIVRKRFVPFNYLSARYDGFTVTEPSFGSDLTHAHNRIPLGTGRLIVSFESHLPRQFGLAPDGALVELMMKRLRSRTCRRIIGMSHFAKRLFLDQHQDLDLETFEILSSKLMVRHPNVDVRDTLDPYDPDSDDGPLRLVFVGGHFARKGGCVAVRVAELSRERGLPVHVTIISSMMMGEAVWTDPTDPDVLAPYAAGLDAPNVTHLEGQPNQVVRQIMGQSHFSLLPTFADTFGFSAIESMAEHTPVIATKTGALPEFITDTANGIMLDIETTDAGEWAGLNFSARGTKAYADRFVSTIDDLAEQTLRRIEPYLDNRQALVPLRAAARQTAETMFDARQASANWDTIYDRVIAEDMSQQAQLDPLIDVSSPDGWPGPASRET